MGIDVPLRIVSYNVRYFGHALRGAGSTRGCLDAIATSLANLTPPADIVCLQEVETRSLRSRLCHTPGNGKETQLDALTTLLDMRLVEKGETIRYNAYYFPAHAYRIVGQPLYTTGLAVLAATDLSIERHNVDAPHDITHRRIRSVAKLKQSRICAHVRLYDRRGTSLDIFNTHLSLPAFATPDFFAADRPRMGFGKNQEKEAESLGKFVTRTKKSDRFVVVGDFNALPASPTYTLVQEATGAQDPFPAVTRMDEVQMQTLWPTAGFMHLRMRLDHIFVGRGIQCLDFDDSHPFGEEGRWHGLSDHVPLVGRFRTR